MVTKQDLYKQPRPQSSAASCHYPKLPLQSNNSACQPGAQASYQGRPHLRTRLSPGRQSAYLAMSSRLLFLQTGIKANAIQVAMGKDVKLVGCPKPGRAARAGDQEKGVRPKAPPPQQLHNTSTLASINALSPLSTMHQNSGLVQQRTQAACNTAKFNSYSSMQDPGSVTMPRLPKSAGSTPGSCQR